MPTQVSFGGQIVASAGFVDGYQSVPDSGDHHCFVTRLPVLEVTTWQTGKFRLPAVRSDKNEFHQDILWAAAQDAQGCKRRMPTHQRTCNRVIDVVLWTLSSKPCVKSLQLAALELDGSSVLGL